eukprot:4492760-Pyramimonas_sp.AAC.1
MVDNDAQGRPGGERGKVCSGGGVKAVDICYRGGMCALNLTAQPALVLIPSGINIIARLRRVAACSGTEWGGVARLAQLLPTVCFAYVCMHRETSLLERQWAGRNGLKDWVSDIECSACPL